MFDLKRFRKTHKLTQFQLGEILGVNQATVARVENGHMNIPARWIEVLKEKFVNALNIVAENNDPHGLNETHLAYYVKEPLKTIEADPNGRDIPLYKGAAFATISPAMGDVVTLVKDTFIRIPMFSQGQYAVQVTGHSMKGYINHGDWIVIKQITNRDAIIYGEPYLVITKSDNLKTVKFIKEGDIPENLWLVPYNIEQFEPQIIDKIEILELYRVVGLFRTV